MLSTKSKTLSELAKKLLHNIESDDLNIAAECVYQIASIIEPELKLLVTIRSNNNE